MNKLTLSVTFEDDDDDGPRRMTFVREVGFQHGEGPDCFGYALAEAVRNGGFSPGQVAAQLVNTLGEMGQFRDGDTRTGSEYPPLENALWEAAGKLLELRDRRAAERHQLRQKGKGKSQ